MKAQKKKQKTKNKKKKERFFFFFSFSDKTGGRETHKEKTEYETSPPSSLSFLST